MIDLPRFLSYTRTPTPQLSPKPISFLPPVKSPTCSRISRKLSPVVDSDRSLYGQLRSGFAFSPSKGRSKADFATRKEKRLEMLKGQHSVIEAAIEDRKRKLILLKQLNRRYHVHIPRSCIETLSEFELVSFAKRKWARCLAKRCAKAMKSWLAHRRKEKLAYVRFALEHMSAFRIQRFWRKHSESIRKQTCKGERECAAVCIQRHIRGFLARRRYRIRKFYSDLTVMHLNARVMRRVGLHMNPVKNIFQFWLKNIEKLDTGNTKEDLGLSLQQQPHTSHKPASLSPIGKNKKEGRTLGRKTNTARTMSVIVPAVKISKSKNTPESISEAKKAYGSKRL